MPRINPSNGRFLKEDPEEVFLRYSIPEPTSGCFLWLGSSDGRGRPIMYGHDGKPTYAYRFAWSRENGPIRKGLVVRHRACRNPGCVNVAHLSVGTGRDNANDRERDGMTAKGERNGYSKLKEAQIQQIRDLRDYGFGCVWIARQYGIAPSHASQIGLRHVWRSC